MRCGASSSRSCRPGCASACGCGFSGRRGPYFGPAAAHLPRPAARARFAHGCRPTSVGSRPAMLLASLLDTDLSSWQTFTIPLAGVAGALLALTFGWLALSHWRGRAAPSEPAAEAPVHDPFDHGSLSE